MLLCMAMLVGSTMAWFTDSVTTGVNKIVAGNLDVELYAKVNGTYTEVTDETNLFMKDALWEPGHVEVIDLKVKNVGTLALKYQLGINVADEKGSINVQDKNFKLSDFIEFAVIDGESNFGTGDAGREAALAAAEGKSVKLSELAVNENDILYPNGKGESEGFVTLVVYMPTTVDNIANYKTGAETPEITLGVSLVATQTPYEEDSFDKNYDGTASFPVLDGKDLKNALEAGGIVEVTADVTAENENTYDGRNSVTQDTVLNMGNSKITFENAATNEDMTNISAIYQMSGGTTLTLNAEDGGIDSDFYGIVVGAVDNPEGDDLIINGGNYKAGSVVQVQHGTVTINGGFFDGRAIYGNSPATFLLNCLDVPYDNKTADIIVKGGTFVNFDPSNNKAEGDGTNFLADGYKVISEVKDGATFYTVVEDVPAA